MAGLWRTVRRLSEDHDLLTPGARLRNAAALLALLAFSASARGAAPSDQFAALVVREPTVSAMEAGPLWVSKATWDPAEERIVIADPGSGRIYVYDVLGRIHRRVVNPGRGALEFTKPNYASRVGNRYLIATAMNQWIWFDQDLVAESGWALDWEEGEGLHSQLAASEFDLSDTHMYAIGNTMSFNGQWSDRAVFSISLGDRTVRRVARLAKDDNETSYYRAPPFNLSVCAGKAWLLQMAATVSIVEAREGGTRLHSFPPEFQKRPSIPLLVNADSVRSRAAALRNNAVAEGLFCADDRLLLLLARRPRGNGGLQWLVYPIDPVRDVMGRPIELPTTAGEIVFVPGRKRWAVLEKGPMKYVAVQPLTRIISFPRPALSSTTSRKAP